MEKRFVEHRVDRTDLLDIWIGRDLKTDQYIVDSYMKTDEGLRHISGRFDREPSNLDLLEMGKKEMYVSRRPFEMDQLVDKSSNAPIYALLDDFCSSNGINIKDLVAGQSATVKKALSPERLVEAIEFANWQGVAYPQNWDRGDFEKLVESMNKIGLYNVSDTLQDFVAIKGTFNEEIAGQETSELRPDRLAALMDDIDMKSNSLNRTFEGLKEAPMTDDTDHNDDQPNHQR